MAIDSKDPNEIENKQDGKLNGNANKSLPSFDPNQNQYKNNQNNRINDNPQTIKGQAKKTLLKEGIKKGAAVYGVPEAATNAILETETGQEILNAASNTNSATEGATAIVKVITKKTLLKVLPIVISPLLLIIILFLMIFSKDPVSGIGDGSDIYEELRQEIVEVVSSYRYKADIDGTLILATLIGYNDSEGLDENSSSVDIKYLKKHVEILAKYQIMTNKSCEYDSSTLRQIASNDDWLLGEFNYNCIEDMEGETYTLSIEEGKYNDNNSGSVYYWNLIDEDFIFNLYNEYMVNKEKNTSENVEKINEIIEDIYDYYRSILEDEDVNSYFKQYSNNNSFYWPIGSSDTEVIDGKLYATGVPTSTYITSYYGYREIQGVRGNHGAIDISGSLNSDYVIATSDGVVVYPTSLSQTRYENGCYKASSGCTNYNDGGGLGNYVIIDHGNGVYSYYGHMYKNTITITAGDTVKQGQVIGKVGTSGNSTGPHLHFEIRVGGMDRSFRVDPLTYVDPNNARPTSTKLIDWIKTVEGGTSGSYVNGNNYVVYDGKDGVLTVGYGIVIVDKSGNQLYRDIYDIPVKEGSLIPIPIVDKMFNQITDRHRSLLNSYITNNNTTLNYSQYDAILSLMYNCGAGYGSKAVTAYGSSKNTNALWNEMSQCKNAVINGKLQELYGLKLRRAEEFELFLTGDYKYDPLSYIGGNKVKYYDVKSW